MRACVCVFVCACLCVCVCARTALPAVCSLSLTGPRRLTHCCPWPARHKHTQICIKTHTLTSRSSNSNLSKQNKNYKVNTRTSRGSVSVNRDPLTTAGNTIIFSPRPSWSSRLFTGITPNFITGDRRRCACAQLPCGRYWASDQRMGRGGGRVIYLSFYLSIFLSIVYAIVFVGYDTHWSIPHWYNMYRQDMGKISMLLFPTPILNEYINSLS